jgi:inward rectifier potassium channel
MFGNTLIFGAKIFPMIKNRVIPRRINKRTLERELGLGSNAASEGRMMNADGTFNIERDNATFGDNAYYHLVGMSWVQFIGIVLLLFVCLNIIFSLVYNLIGVEHLKGIEPGSFWHNFTQAYFFSSQTLTTVGYGHVSPSGLLTNIVASLESFMGLLSFALVSGLLYGRFSRPQAHIAFSEQMVVSPFKSGHALMFRMANARRSELIETEVQMLLTMNQTDDNGNTVRRYWNLPLEINKISFFTLSWTLVHAITEESPLWGLGADDLAAGNAEVFVLIKGNDDTYEQMVHARRSYRYDEIVWNARFKPIIVNNSAGHLRLLTDQIGAYNPL